MADWLLLAQTTVLVQKGSVAPSTGFAVGWGTLSFINAGLAQSKNHSGLLWWVASLVLGPIATFLIVAVLDKKEDATGFRPEFKEVRPED